MLDLVMDAATSPVAALGHGSYLLLVVSMLMRRMALLRILVILSASTGIVYSGLILDWVSVFWGSLLIAVNVGQLALTAWQDRRARFDADEAAFMARHFAGLSRGRQRALLDLGEWVTLSPGATLCAEGRPVPAVYYLAHGEARVTAGGAHVGTCRAGAFIGELTVASGDPASGTVEVVEEARLWRMEAGRVRWALEARPELGRALEASFFHAVRDKLVQSNRRTVEAAVAE